MENMKQDNKKKIPIIISSIIVVIGILIAVICVSKCSSSKTEKNVSGLGDGTSEIVSEDSYSKEKNDDLITLEDSSLEDDGFANITENTDSSESETSKKSEEGEHEGFIKGDEEDENLLTKEDEEELDEEVEKEVSRPVVEETKLTEKKEPSKIPPRTASEHKNKPSPSAKKSSEKENKAPKDPKCIELEKLFKQFKTTDSDEEKKLIVNEAFPLSQEVISKELESREAHFFIAQDYLNKNNYDAAAKELNEAISIGPDYLFYYYLGKILYTKGDFNGAIRAFKKSCELNMKFAPSRYNLGLSYVRVNKIDQALSSYKQAVAIKPNYEQAYLGMGRLYKQVRFYEDALASYKKAVEINEQNVSARMDMGVIYNELGEYPKAISVYKDALQYSELGEIQTILKYNLSVALYNNENYDQALSVSKESYEEKVFITDKNEEANITYNYGLILETCEYYEEAVKIYKEALAINKNHLKAKINLSALYMKAENPNADEVLRLLNEAYVVAPFNFEVNNNLGNAYVLKEDYNSAVIYLNNALTSHPDDKVVKQNLASSFLKAENYVEAEKIYLEIVEDDKTNYGAYLDLAKIYIQIGKDDKAMVYLVYLQKNAPDFKKEEVELLLANLNI